MQKTSTLELHKIFYMCCADMLSGPIAWIIIPFFFDVQNFTFQSKGLIFHCQIPLWPKLSQCSFYVLSKPTLYLFLAYSPTPLLAATNNSNTSSETIYQLKRTLYLSRIVILGWVSHFSQLVINRKGRISITFLFQLLASLEMEISSLRELFPYFFILFLFFKPLNEP